MTKKTMLAAFVAAFAFTSCHKDPQPTPDPEPEPTTQTVLTGMVATGVTFYDSVTYSYEYDDEYRITRIESHVTNNGYLIQNLFLTYSDGHILVAGTESESPVTIECTLDDEGRITHIERTSLLSDSTTLLTVDDFTYDAEGRLVSEHTLSGDSGQGATNTYVWEGDDIVAVNTEGGIISIEYVASHAPAQALFHILRYNIELSALCAQGCFGTLPAHMPAQRTMTTSVPIPGMPPIIETSNYTYTVDAEGHLTTCVETGETNDHTTNYTFNWEER